MYISYRGHVYDHVPHVHVHVYIVTTMLTELTVPTQNGNTPLHLAVLKEGHTTWFSEQHFSATPSVSWSVVCAVYE